MGKLKVLVGDEKKEIVVFTKSGNQGNTWHRASFNITYPGKSKVRKSTVIARERSFLRLSKKLYYHNHFEINMNNVKNKWKGINLLITRKRKGGNVITALKRPGN